MGEVYKARDTRLDRTVALKVSRSEFTDRFQHEARSIAALNHPYIATPYDVGPDYLVMEYVEGETLRSPLPLPRALQYAAQILEALEAAHRKGIVHRDLKPGNIMVAKAGIKLLDFGLAKRKDAVTAADETAAMTVSMEGSITGTLPYMSPEQLEGKGADERSDIFAFGAVLLRDAHWATRVQGREPRHRDLLHHDRRAAMAVRAAAQRPVRPRAHRSPLPSEGSR
jgi:serine/threonine protein kinase